jgi:hypothetical protein
VSRYGPDHGILEKAEKIDIGESYIYDVARYRQDTSAPITTAPWSNTNIPFPIKILEKSGNYIYVAEVASISPIYMRLGSARNPWFRIHQGDTIQREFRRIYMTPLDRGTGATANPGIAEAVLYISRGPFISRPTIPIGYSGPVCNQVALAAGVVTNISNSAAGAGPLGTVGRMGGIVKVQNRGLNPCDIDLGFPNVPPTANPGTFLTGNGWTLDPAPAATSFVEIRLKGALAHGVTGLYAVSALGTTVQVLTDWESDMTAIEAFSGLNSLTFVEYSG